MIVIGMCGGSGSGKGTVCDIFSQFDIPSVDTDEVYRSLTESKSECLSELAEAFGCGILTESGTLDRKTLADIVFSQGAQDKKTLLEKITHKHILALTREKLREFSEEGRIGAIVDAPLLFESGFDSECDTIIAVIADKSKRIERIMKRDGLTFEKAVMRIDAQMSDEKLISRSDHVIYNNGTTDELYSQIKKIINEILIKDRVK